MMGLVYAMFDFPEGERRGVFRFLRSPPRREGAEKSQCRGGGRALQQQAPAEAGLQNFSDRAGSGRIRTMIIPIFDDYRWWAVKQAHRLSPCSRHEESYDPTVTIVLRIL